MYTPSIVALLHPDTPKAGEFVSPFAQPLAQPTQEYLDFYNQLGEVPFAQAWKERLPAETYDHIVSGAGGPDQFLTSDQCAGCHDATYSNATLPNMILKEPQQDGSIQFIHLSPYAEWRASPMGLAGRDPVFFFQLQSETNTLPALATCIENTCLHCYGVMGQRQLAIDTAGQDDAGCKALFAIAPPEVPFGAPFLREVVITSSDLCGSCHNIIAIPQMRQQEQSEQRQAERRSAGHMATIWLYCVMRAACDTDAIAAASWSRTGVLTRSNVRCGWDSCRRCARASRSS